MSVQSDPARIARNSLNAAISSTVIRLLREYSGRGPTKGRTTIRDNVVVVMLEQTLTKGEESLVRKGRAEKVLEMRREFQEAMREDCIAEVARLTGRNVIAMMSSNHIGPDLAVEVFVLDAPPSPDLMPLSDIDAPAMLDGARATSDGGQAQDGQLQ